MALNESNRSILEAPPTLAMVLHPSTDQASHRKIFPLPSCCFPLNSSHSPFSSL